MPFSGLRVLTLESRKAKDMEALILREEGIPIVAPSVRERGLEDDQTGVYLVEQLEADVFDMIILMTGVGLGFLRDLVIPKMPVERFTAALKRATIVARGPKPIVVLKQLGLQPDVVIGEPNTWKEIVAAVAERTERRIAVQEYGRPNAEMNSALERLGATVTPFAIYRWEMPEDPEPLRAAAAALARGECDVVLFTSSIQLDHLLEAAGSLREGVELALRTKVVVASIGPVMTAALEGKGIKADIIPKHPKMWALVKAAAEQAQELLRTKRG
ncbi:MAG TPA: uroporphyrinogen-III synthase [Bryobacteraceae bacterium]|jgi:uroporphyrinogen-III synthase